ncbi:MAG: SDR family oxidoreductase [Methylobacteriaceae bacterium]|nr:SDR family oxidoreductase [Methylobacteriaceae bacterium]
MSIVPSRVVEVHGRLDILVCNAGILKQGSFVNATATDWTDVVAVNLTRLMHCIRAASGPMLRADSDRIVNIASISAERGGGSLGNVLYGATKAGVVPLTKGLAREFGPSGVTVNAVAPAVAETAMTQTSLSEKARADIVSRIPLRRLATPSDIADAVVFLASDRSSCTNGAVLPVEGGILTT